MHPISRAVLAGFAVVMLAGCSSMWSKKDDKHGIDYSTPGASSESRRSTLEVPPDLVTPAQDSHYAVPDGSTRGVATYSGYVADRTPSASAPAAAPAAPLQTNTKIRIERAGNERWLVVQGTDTAALWPRMQEFWRDLGFILIVDNQAAGLMETEWAENHAKVPGDMIQSALQRMLGTHYSTGERDKFRVRLESTSQPGSVEIYISNRRMEEVHNSGDQDGTHWEPRPNDPELEGAMLQRLMVRLGTDEKVAQKMVAETKTAAPARASVAPGPNGVLQLTVNDNLDRAWRQVGLALDRTGVVVEDRDRAKGIYFVRYIVNEDPNTAKEKQGWFARHFSFSSKKPAGTDKFRIQVSADGERTTVTLLNKDGGAAPAESSKQILTLLFNELK